MTSAAGPRIAIIGAGFSGSLLAVQLLKRALPNGRIYLIEKNAQFGGGLAYSTGNANHLLNVRASRMSAFVDEPDHFVNWLKRRDNSANASAAAGTVDTFVPRQLYGAYIQDLLGNEIWQTGRGRNLHLVPDEATAIETAPDGLVVEVGTGRRYEVDGAVLAVGNFPQQERHGALLSAIPGIARATADLDPQAPVLLIGTGLTMVDSVISLLDAGHRGRIYALSRRGLLPRRHGEATAHGSPGCRCGSRARRSPTMLHAGRAAGKCGRQIMKRSGARWWMRSAPTRNSFGKACRRKSAAASCAISGPGGMFIATAWRPRSPMSSNARCRGTVDAARGTPAADDRNY